jgi:hypothetical protein
MKNRDYMIDKYKIDLIRAGWKGDDVCDDLTERFIWGTDGRGYYEGYWLECTCGAIYTVKDYNIKVKKEMK